LLAVLDAYPSEPELRDQELDARQVIELNFRHVGFEFDPAELDGDQEALFERFRDYLRAQNVSVGHLEGRDLLAVRDVFLNNVRLMRRYEPRVLRADLLFFAAGRSDRHRAARLDANSWKSFVDERIDIHVIDVEHGDMMTDAASVTRIGSVLARWLASTSTVETVGKSRG
jgi:hypothetical protein